MTVLAAAACAETVLPPVVTPPLDLRLSTDSLVLTEGDTVRITASIALDTAGALRAPLRPVWIATDTAVAVVDSSGLVTARGPGRADIAVLAEGRVARAAIRVFLQFAALAGPLDDGCGLTVAGRAWCWPGDTVPQLRRHDRKFTVLTKSAGVTCGLATDSTTWCWGQNRSGALGNGTFNESATPVQIAGGLVFTSVTAGARVWGAAAVCGLAATGQAWCWGHNAWGGLGDGSTVARSAVPVMVQGGHQFVSVVPGEGVTCALKANGEAWCWGANNEGQLGLGTRDSLRRTPGVVPVPVGTRFVQLAADVLSFCGLTDDGRVLCWGSNFTKGLGRTDPACDDPDYLARNLLCVAAPDTVAGGRRYRALASGGYGTCALDLNGVPWCWGWEFYYPGLRFGTPNPVRSAVPVRAMGSLTLRSIGVGEYLTCGRVEDGTVYCAGYAFGGTPRRVALQR